MLDFEDSASRREICFTKVVQLPASIDPEQVPTKKPPFSTVVHHPFLHTVEVILPKKIYSAIKPALDSQLEKPRCARVFMSPKDILEREFFNEYIKKGNILMISEGLTGSDVVYTLRDGILRVELGREIYERTGLNGKPIRSGGRKHAKERFAIELNLRLPSMLHGKQGFERIVWAFKNVLDQSIAWLFCDLDPAALGYDGNKPINKHYPQWIDCTPHQTSYEQILVPALSGLVSENASELELQESCGELSEWIGMVQIGSPRVSANDDIDPYLSRYQVPNIDHSKATDLISLKWRGLLSSKWTLQLLVSLM